ncbi:MAG: acyltransferase [Coriobacteriia bacterium]|nr:acyltransferase [Coriobacteriia bacterium]
MTLLQGEAGWQGDEAPGEEGVRANRIPLYDYLRVFALLTVVAIHVLAGYLSNRETVWSPDLLLAFDHLLHYAVPMFVFISGALVWGRVRSWELSGYGAFLKRRVAVVVVPYVAWGAIFYLLRPAAEVSQFPASRLAAVREFLELLLNGHIWYHLYFVPMIVVFYLLTPLAQAVLRRSPEALLLLVVGVRVFFGPAIVTAFADLSAYEVLKPLLVDVVEHAPFMALGAWYAVRFEVAGRVLSRVWPFVLALGAAMWPAYTMRAVHISQPYVRRVYEFAAIGSLILGFVGAFTLVGRVRSDLDEKAKSLADLTYGAYLAHPLVIFAMRKSVGLLGIGAWWDSLLFVAVFLAIAVTVTLALVSALKRTPVLRRFV